MSSIQFDANLNTDKLESAIRRSDKSVADWVKGIEKGGDAAEKAFNRAAKITEKQKSLIKELDDAMKKVYASMQTAIKMGNIDAADKLTAQLSKLRNAREQAQANLSKLQKSSIQDNIAEQASVENLSDSVGDLVKSYGGAAAILGVLQKAFKETTGGMNLFNVAGAVTEQVLYDIVSGSNIAIARLQAVASIQRELNALREKEYKDSYFAAQFNNQYQQLYSDSLDATLNRTEKLEAIDAALEAHNKAIDIQVENVRENLEIAEKLFSFRPGSEKLKKQISEFNIQLENLDAERVSSTKRLTRQRSQLIQDGIEEELKWREDLHKKFEDYIKSEEKRNEEYAKKLKELNDEITLGKLKGMDHDLKELEIKYKADLETYKDSQEIKTALTARYEQERHEIEMKYLNDLKKENEKLQVLIAPGSLAKKAIIARGGKPMDITLGWSGDTTLRENKTEQYTEDEIKKREKLTDIEMKRRDLMMSIVDYSAEFTSTLEQQGLLTKEAVDQFSAMAGTIGNLASGNYLGAAMNVLQNLVINFQRTFPNIMQKESDRLQLKISEINDLLEKQERIIQQSERKGGQKLAQQGNSDFIQQKIDENNASIEQSNKIAGQWWRFQKTRDGALENVILLTEENEKLQLELEDSKQALNDLFTGGITENEIADVIATGIIEGAEAGTQAMDSMMKGALTEIFKKEILGPQITEATKYLSEKLKDGVFDDEEKAEFDRRVKEISENSKIVWENFSQAYDFTGGQNKGLSGSISRSITEETGSELAGLFRRFADDGRLTKDYTKAGVDHLVKIEANTYNTVEELKKTNTKLDTTNTKLDTVITNTNQNATGDL